MSLAASCPRCSSPVTEDDDGWRCLDHGRITPLWRPAEASYEALTEHLLRCTTVPTLLPWPLSPGWTITDFGCVGSPRDGEARASLASCSGTSDLDGVVELTVVSEEPGVGLGARIAGVDHTDPGAEIGDGPPHAKVRVDGRPVSLWSVSTSHSDSNFDRSVFAGEAQGRWLWLVMRPASAALLLNDEWILLDVSDLGPELMELPFGGHPPPW
ncbi:hypothetical protein K1X13_11435 [Nocardioides sp. WL0053]|uniref:Uncharacterized protein n=1 Tax=Nocardioides jiangsuensis TaxID=2866161 RepID=A0ABS7RK68_9ACTN|nr:DUF6758 family protein [Nocardioides jiangsuensis]MBY9075433.1 hypothetical protein [Nocardioides jiangsuensis]